MDHMVTRLGDEDKRLHERSTSTMGRITPSATHPLYPRMRRRRRISTRAFCFASLLLSLLFSFHHRHGLLTVVDASSAAGQETLIGIVGKDFVLLGADSSLSQSIAVTASNLDKIAVISDPFPHYHDGSHDSYSTSLHPTTSDKDDAPHSVAAGASSPGQLQRHSIFRQRAILAAAAGDAADADRLLGLMTALATIQEYENGFGCDVDIIDGSSISSSNKKQRLPGHVTSDASMGSSERDQNSPKNGHNHPLHPSRFFKMWSKSSTTFITAASDRPIDAMVNNNGDNDHATTSTDTPTLQQQSPLPPPIGSSLAGLTVEGVAQMARTQIAQALRSRTPYRVCLLVAGLQPVVINTGSAVPQPQQEEEQQEQIVGQPATEPEYMSRTLQRQVQSSWLPPPPQPKTLPAALASPAVPNEADAADTTAEQDNEESKSAMSSSSSSALTMSDQEAQEQQQRQQPETTTTPATTKHHHHDTAVVDTNNRLDPRLYWLDEYGSIQQLPYGAHGYGSHFVWSILDDGYRPEMGRDEAILLMKSCFEQLRQRYVINAQAQTPPCIKCLDAHGWQLIR